MKRKFVTNLILLISLNLLIKPYYIFGIERTVQNIVGDESYGLYFSLLNFSILINILLDVGITNFNNRNIAQHHFLLKKHFSNIVGLKLVLAVFYAIFCLVAATLIGYDKVQIHLLFFLIFNQFLTSFILYLRSNISGLHYFRTDSLISVLDRSIMIIIFSFLLFNQQLKSHFTIEWFVYVQTIAYLLTALITFFVLLNKSGKIRIRFNLKFALVFLRKSYPYALLILLMSFYNRIDSVMLERLLPDSVGKEQAGIYAQAFRLLDAVSILGVLMAGLLLPIFAKMIKLKEHIGGMVKLSFSIIIVVALTIAISSIYYNEEIMSLLYKTNTSHSSGILGILMTGYIGIATTYIFGTLLTANGSIKELNLMAFAGMILNVVLNLFLIPRFLAFGSAYASLATQFFTAIAQVIIAARIFKLKTDLRFISLLVVYALILVAMASVSKMFNTWFYGYFFLLATSAIGAFAIRLISIKDLVLIIKSDK